MMRALAMVWTSAPRWTLLSGLLVAIQAGLTLGGLYLLKVIVDTISLGATATPSAQTLTSRVFFLFALAAALALAGVACRALAGLAAEAKAQLVTDRMLERLHRKAISVDLSYYENPDFHSTLHRAQQEAPVRPTRLLANVTQVAQSSLTAVGVLILLATIHWMLAGLLTVAALPALALHMRHSRRAHRWNYSRSPEERRSNYYGWVIGSPEHAKEVRTFGLGGELVQRFRALRSELRMERLRLTRDRVLAGAGGQALGTLVVMGALTFIALQTLEGAITLGAMVMFFGAVQRGQSLLQSLFQGLGGLYEDNLFLTDLDEFLEMEPSVVAPPRPQLVPSRIRTGLSCHNVSFRYPGASRWALRDVNLELHPGEVVALVGPNGSGKSTLSKLLCRLYDPDSGSITLDGVDLRSFDPAVLRKKFAVVFQDFAHYHVTAGENIWFGNTDQPADSDRIERAGVGAGVHGAISRLTHGYQTQLGHLFPGGEQLSIGEWQKLALARAFMGDAEILLVDEPTSALDAHAEAEVSEAMANLFRTRSALVVSHRLSTIRHANRIYYLDEGRIVECGTHEELVTRDGPYARVYARQAAPYRGSQVPHEMGWTARG